VELDDERPIRRDQGREMVMVRLVPPLRAPGIVWRVAEPAQDAIRRDEIFLSCEEIHVAHRPEGRVPIHGAAERGPFEHDVTAR
jgi:hypothetical protein